ncbi:MAG: aconitate hydratase AcnA [Acidobacteria bacterium]|nr:aconitate hydratase AcnA [Acidobacteriota bacterium]
MSTNSFAARTDVSLAGESVEIFSLPALERNGFTGVASLPFSLKILLENLLRHEDQRFVHAKDIEALAAWKPGAQVQKEISFAPARVLLQDFTGVPCVVDLAAMRDGCIRLGGNPDRVNPLQPVELVIDHSVQVDYFGRADAFTLNAELEFARNKERYSFLRWGQDAFRNFRVVPPDTGIVHQVNIEYLARVIFRDVINGKARAYPDTLVGTDSHTTMVNGLGVLGWGVGGIEAEAAMLGQPMSMLIPPVLGFKLKGTLPEGTTATDLVLMVTERLRKHGVVGKFVEFLGPGLAHLTIADRATLGNMCPEYGATAAMCPIDEMTLDYLKLTGRSPSHVRLVEEYAKTQGLFRDPSAPDASYDEAIELELGSVEPSLAGPRRPQDRVSLRNAKTGFQQALGSLMTDRKGKAASTAAASSGVAVLDAPPEVAGGFDHGAVVIAAITSCTNTSNPSVMIGAGLLAKKAFERGLRSQSWVKTSLAPGSKVVTEYLDKAGLTRYLDALGFNLVGYGCTTCIGNSGPLPEDVSAVVADRNLVVCSVLSGNRNFEGRIQSQVRANYLASPPLVVAYALAGRMTIDLTSEPLGRDSAGKDVYLREIWPSGGEIQDAMLSAVKSEMFQQQYANVFDGDERWRSLEVPAGDRFVWDERSTYIRRPPFVEGISKEPVPLADVRNARVLALLGDSVTTDHISPAGSIPADSPAGTYLVAQGVAPRDFNSYGARRGNHEVMVRGTFANIRLRNQLAPGTEGGWTLYQGHSNAAAASGPPAPGGELMTIYDASVRYQAAGVPLLVLAGKEYGSGSSRDWAAKGTLLLGVRAVIAESFERIHRSNLVNMGVLPLQFKAGDTAASLGLRGTESYDIAMADLKPRAAITVRVQGADGRARDIQALVRIDTPEELAAFRHGGILPYVLRQLVG